MYQDLLPLHNGQQGLQDVEPTRQSNMQSNMQYNGPPNVQYNGPPNVQSSNQGQPVKFSKGRIVFPYEYDRDDDDNDEDDEDDEDDVDRQIQSLQRFVGLLRLYNSPHTQLPILKSLCEQVNQVNQLVNQLVNKEPSEKIDKVVSEFVYVMMTRLETLLYDCNDDMPVALHCLQYTVTLLTSLAGTFAFRQAIDAKTHTASGTRVIDTIACIIADTTLCQSVRYGCAQLVVTLVTTKVDFVARATVIDAVKTSCTTSQNRVNNGELLRNKLEELLQLLLQ